MFMDYPALAFGADIDGWVCTKAIEFVFGRPLEPKFWTILIPMQLSFILMGTFLTTLRCWWSRRFMCRSLGLVDLTAKWHPLYNHDVPYDAALRLRHLFLMRQ
jgi:hypothetical protein